MITLYVIACTYLYLVISFFSSGLKLQLRKQYNSLKMKAKMEK